MWSKSPWVQMCPEEPSCTQASPPKEGGRSKLNAQHRWAGGGWGTVAFSVPYPSSLEKAHLWLPPSQSPLLLPTQLHRHSRMDLIPLPQAQA